MDDRLDKAARAALLDYRDTDPMPDARKHAAWSRLQAALAAGDEPVTAAPSPPTRNKWMVAALIAAAVVLTIAGIQAVTARRASEATPQEAVHGAARSDSQPTVRAPSRASPSGHVAEDRPEPTPSPRSKPRAPAEPDLDAELALLRAARAALADHRTDDALALLAEHARRFDRGLLAEERVRLRVQALCDAGATTRARAEAAAFARANPESPHTPKLLRVCAP